MGLAPEIKLEVVGQLLDDRIDPTLVKDLWWWPLRKKVVPPVVKLDLIERETLQSFYELVEKQIKKIWLDHLNVLLHLAFCFWVDQLKIFDILFLKRLLSIWILPFLLWSIALVILNICCFKFA